MESSGLQQEQQQLSQTRSRRQLAKMVLVQRPTLCLKKKRNLNSNLTFSPCMFHAELTGLWNKVFCSPLCPLLPTDARLLPLVLFRSQFARELQQFRARTQGNISVTTRLASEILYLGYWLSILDGFLLEPFFLKNFRI